MKLFLFFSLTFSFLISLPAFSKDPLQTGTSVSHFYDARSVFVNPAALSYQSALNGSGFLSSFSWGQKESNDDFALGLSLGSFGFGVERYFENLESFSRYSLASGLPVSPWVYLGSRISFTSASPTLEGTTQVDLGLQIRPAPFFSVGILGTRLNRPTQNGRLLNRGYSVGVTLQPITPWLIQFDYEDDRNYQGSTSFEILRGLFLQAGYDNRAKAHFGIQWDIGRTSITSVSRPEKTDRLVVSHAQFAHRPKPSLLAEQNAVSMKMDSSLKEKGEGTSFFAAGSDSFSEMLWNINEAARNPELDVLFLELETFPLGMGAASELHEALWKVRESGKIVHVALSNARLKEYLIASAANFITLAPAGSIDWSGPRSERYYLKGTLEKVGIEAEMVAKGAYKSAPETFNSKKASEKSRENILQNLSEAEKEIETYIKKSGRVTESSWQKARKLGVLSDKEALELKLIDSIEEPREAKEKITAFFRIGSGSTFSSRRLALPPRVGVMVASGDIVREKVKLLGLMGSEQIIPEKIAKQIQQMERDPLIKAVVIRVSSGGGDVLASQSIANQIKALNKKKPVVISMGDVAASGGYMISAPAASIFASPLTLTGSIGVFSGKPNFSALYEKIDLHKEVISKSPYPGLFSEAKAWTFEEREIITRQVNHFYESFLDYVSQHRPISLKEVDKVAQGRVWLGRKASELKLVDNLTGVLGAIEAAKNRGGLTDFEVKWIYPPSYLFDAITETAILEQSASLLQTEIRANLISDKPFLYWTPENLN